MTDLLLEVLRFPEDTSLQYRKGLSTLGVHDKDQLIELIAEGDLDEKDLMEQGIPKAAARTIVRKVKGLSSPVPVSPTSPGSSSLHGPGLAPALEAHWGSAGYIITGPLSGTEGRPVSKGGPLLRVVARGFEENTGVNPSPTVSPQAVAPTDDGQVGAHTASPKPENATPIIPSKNTAVRQVSSKGGLSIITLF